MGIYMDPKRSPWTNHVGSFDVSVSIPTIVMITRLSSITWVLHVSITATGDAQHLVFQWCSAVATWPAQRWLRLADGHWIGAADGHGSGGHGCGRDTTRVLQGDFWKSVWRCQEEFLGKLMKIMSPNWVDRWSQEPHVLTILMHAFLKMVHLYQMRHIETSRSLRFNSQSEIPFFLFAWLLHWRGEPTESEKEWPQVAGEHGH